jgi:hypothetical protein
MGWATYINKFPAQGRGYQELPMKWARVSPECWPSATGVRSVLLLLSGLLSGFWIPCGGAVLMLCDVVNDHLTTEWCSCIMVIQIHIKAFNFLRGSEARCPKTWAESSRVSVYKYIRQGLNRIIVNANTVKFFLLASVVFSISLLERFLHVKIICPSACLFVLPFLIVAFIASSIRARLWI